MNSNESQAVLTGFKENLHAVFCLAENSVGPLSTRPDDIHTLYSGRTVEINNTDAEGRLVCLYIFFSHIGLKYKRICCRFLPMVFSMLTKT